MNKMSRKHTRFRNALLVATGLALVTPFAATQALAAPEANDRPALLITSDPLPENLKQQIYSKPSRVRDIKASDIVGRDYYQSNNTGTVVSQKVNDLTGNLGNLQRKVVGISSELNGLQSQNESKASEYYAAVATVNTQLQSGTTPGNPRLVKRLSEAEGSLDSLSSSVIQLNQLAADTAQTASEAAFLLEETRAAYNLSGAIEEDHIDLAELEDTINNTVVVIERVLNNVNDDITRTSTYLSSERDNLRTLSLAVSNGDLYGKSLSDRPFSSAGSFIQASADASAPMGAPSQSSASYGGGMRPLVKIRFDKPDVDYEQPIYTAVNEALQRYPDARFNLVAVHPTQGNAAEVAIESTRARRNAERVLRTLTQMGLALDRIDLSYNESAEAVTNEVHLYIH